MSLYAILGGSFDPVHCGHVALVQYVLSYIKESRVIVSCAYQNPHKIENACTASAEHRLAMVQRAFAGMSRVFIDEGEIRARCVSYTVDMLTRLRKVYDVSEKMYFIIGSDLVQSMPQWKDAERLAELVTLLIYPRVHKSELDTHLTRCGSFRCLYMHDAPRIDISSTDIRAAYQERRVLAHALPPSVAAYIRKHALYSEEATHV